VLHLPGHTRGHCAWHFQEHGVLCVGDAIVTWNPFTGRRRPQIPTRASNADSEACMRSLSRLADIDAQLILSGHGDPALGSPAGLVERARRAGFS
jgi:glyoxylase-like metal-dependent hydrolase (beta-lactamase superfamily II)